MKFHEFVELMCGIKLYKYQKIILDTLYYNRSRANEKTSN